ncbi:hypothetical protein WDW86_03450 [Bdellovibrionota bacterium FG-2]
MNKYLKFLFAGGVGVLLVMLLSTTFWKAAVQPDGSLFSTYLFPKFQAKGCIGCHDFYEKRLGGLSFTTHIDRTAEKCVECHKQEVTGFATADEWFTRPGLYTSDMNAQQTCETVLAGMHASFKHKDKLARDLTQHLLGSPRVLWGIADATPNSGRLPEGKVENDLVTGGLEQWKEEVDAWVQGGMKCR